MIKYILKYKIKKGLISQFVSWWNGLRFVVYRISILTDGSIDRTHLFYHFYKNNIIIFFTFLHKIFFKYIKNFSITRSKENINF